jgi:hypothetical protein
MSAMINGYNRGVAVTKSDTVNFDVLFGRSIPTCDALYVGGAGIVVAVFQDGSTANFTAVAGALLPLELIRVNSTTTTATLMVALYAV